MARMRTFRNGQDVELTRTPGSYGMKEGTPIRVYGKGTHGGKTIYFCNVSGKGYFGMFYPCELRKLKTPRRKPRP